VLELQARPAERRIPPADTRLLARTGETHAVDGHASMRRRKVDAGAVFAERAVLLKAMTTIHNMEDRKSDFTFA
jgi:hypothetical protein